MARNGFVGPEHEFVQADVIRWVGEQRRTRNRWDLVFCDVPTFSNSRRMGKTSFDVQRDHAELLIGISRLLTRDGVCVFSCNLRSFRIDEAALAKAGVVAEDISARTIPEDFARNQKIHHCYLVRRTPMEG
jgi:23S rRNA (guanine2445-N2)-methyltransferase / 23S rRNA (guanine2069-N7)-methyltransferase